MNYINTTVYLMRHAKVNSDGRATFGQRNLSLNQDGNDEVSLRIKEFSDSPFGVIFSSSMKRAEQTAEGIALSMTISVHAVKDLDERSWGSLETETDEKRVRHMRQTYQKMTKQERYKARLVPDMETDEEALNRIVHFMIAMVKRYSHQRILMVSHANLIKLFLVHIGFATYEELPSSAIRNTAYAKLSADGRNFVVVETKGIAKTI